MNKKNSNISKYLPQMAIERPYQKAIIFPYKRHKNGKRSYLHLTFLQLNMESNRYAYGLQNSGVKPGMKVLLMVKPSLEFIAITFALFKLGCIPILIDPGMGKNRLLDCIKDVEPQVFIGIKRAYYLRLLYKKYFKTVEIDITVGRAFLGCKLNLDKISPVVAKDFPVYLASPSSLAAILFTSGSTGPAKGVEYEHGMFCAQVKILKEFFNFQPGEVDLPGLFVFALFDVALGMTCVIPDMNPSKPAKVDPVKFVELINDFGVNTSYGSPAIWLRVLGYCEKLNISLPSYKRVMMSGAPISGDLIARFKKIIPNGEVFTPYGATESLPVASLSGGEILNDTYHATKKGKGICVGYPAPGIEIEIITITDQEITNFNDVLILPKKEIGEIIVKGDVVTKQYHNKDKATKMAKIYDGEIIWHRIGDMGYFDEKGRLWFLGRKNHRVTLSNKILFPVACESIFNSQPNIYRSALVGVEVNKKTAPAVIIEPYNGFFPKSKNAEDIWRKELLSKAHSFPHCQEIQIILFHSSFPVDIRHNAKIFREKLAVWAQKQIDAGKVQL